MFLQYNSGGRKATNYIDKELSLVVFQRHKTWPTPQDLAQIRYEACPCHSGNPGGTGSVCRISRERKSVRFSSDRQRHQLRSYQVPLSGNCEAFEHGENRRRTSARPPPLLDQLRHQRSWDRRGFDIHARPCDSVLVNIGELRRWVAIIVGQFSDSWWVRRSRNRDHRKDAKSMGGTQRPWCRSASIGPFVRKILQDEAPLEIAVSEHIRSMPFVWISGDDPPVLTASVDLSSDTAWRC